MSDHVTAEEIDRLHRALDFVEDNTSVPVVVRDIRDILKKLMIEREEMKADLGNAITHWAYHMCRNTPEAIDDHRIALESMRDKYFLSRKG